MLPPLRVSNDDLMAVIISGTIDFPTTAGAYQTSFGGGTDCGPNLNGGDAYVAKLEPPNTPAGASINVLPVDSTTGTTPVELTFDQVTQSGETSLQTSATGAEPPAGFALGDPATYYELATTATFSGMITVCIDYSAVAFSDESALRLYHFEGGVWSDVTSPGFPNVDANIICGEVSSLSPFAVLQETIQPVGFQPPLAALVPEGDEPPLPGNAFKTGSTLSLRLQLLFQGVFLTDADVAAPRIVSLVREGNAIDLQTIDLDSGAANDNGLVFRFSDGNWVYNLSTRGLSTGTYGLTIELPDGFRYSARFVVR